MSFVLLSVTSCAHLWREGVAARRAPPGTATVPLQRNPPRRLLAHSLLGLTLASAPFAVAPSAWADTGRAAPYAGELLALRRTPHLWAVDAAGVALLVADSSALAAHEVDGVAPSEVSIHGLRQLPRGEPWLSLPMVKVGDAVYLPQARDGRVPVGQTAQESSESSAPAEVTAPAELGPPGFRSEGGPSLPPPDRPASGAEWAVA